MRTLKKYLKNIFKGIFFASAKQILAPNEVPLQAFVNTVINFRLS
jgi:hypothetical protein